MLVGSKKFCDTLVLMPLQRRDSKQGWIHGNPVADGWAGAVMQKLLRIQKCDGRTDGRTDGQTDGLTDGLTDGRTGGPTNGPTDRYGKL